MERSLELSEEGCSHDPAQQQPIAQPAGQRRGPPAQPAQQYRVRDRHVRDHRGAVWPEHVPGSPQFSATGGTAGNRCGR